MSNLTRAFILFLFIDSLYLDMLQCYIYTCSDYIRYIPCVSSVHDKGWLLAQGYIFFNNIHSS